MQPAAELGRRAARPRRGAERGSRLTECGTPTGHLAWPAASRAAGTLASYDPPGDMPGRVRNRIRQSAP
jgi:hypothetical protein